MGKKTENIRVLVVDDDPIVTELVRSQLGRLGYIVAGVAFTAESAVTMALAEQPDVILMDLRMSDTETGKEARQAGLEAAKRIYAERPMPIILLTAYESPALVRQASDAGVVGYLVKPVRATELDRAIAIGLARFEDLMRVQKLNRDLQARNAELDAFADTVAHDLKAPLSPIIGYAEVLVRQGEEMEWEQLRHYLEVIAQRGRKIDSIINELLLLASVRKQDIEKHRLDMGEVVKEACRRLEDVIRSSGAQITMPDQWPEAWGYALWVEEIWVNYLSNGIKYGGSPPRLTLGATLLSSRDEQALVRFWIRDNGSGLTEEETNRLFVPFERLSQVRTQGLGLGLSIVRRIVDKLGGEAGVESTPGQGSTFYFTLPSVVDSPQEDT